MPNRSSSPRTQPTRKASSEKSEDHESPNETTQFRSNAQPISVNQARMDWEIEAENDSKETDLLTIKELSDDLDYDADIEVQRPDEEDDYDTDDSAPDTSSSGIDTPRHKVLTEKLQDLSIDSKPDMHLGTIRSSITGGTPTRNAHKRSHSESFEADAFGGGHSTPDERHFSSPGMKRRLDNTGYRRGQPSRFNG